MNKRATQDLFSFIFFIFWPSDQPLDFLSIQNQIKGPEEGKRLFCVQPKPKIYQRKQNFADPLINLGKTKSLPYIWKIYVDNRYRQYNGEAMSEEWIYAI